MSDFDAIRALTCPSCGAQIHAAEGQYRTTCEYCGALLELPHPSKPEAAPTIIARPMEHAPQAGGWGRAVLAVAVVILAAGGLVSYLVVRGLDHASLSHITSALTTFRVSLPAMTVSGADSSHPDAIVTTYDYAKDTRFLSYFDGTTRSLRWQTDPLGDDSYRVAMAENDDRIFVALKTGVMAMDRLTGEMAWQASISDEVPYSCASDCIVVVGQRVVVLASDGGLYGLDAPSGRTVWSSRLNSSPDRLYAIGNRVAVFDNRDGDAVLVMVDPVDGAEVQTLRPQCTDPESGFTGDPVLNAPILVPPDQKSLVILFGFFSSCVQRWDVATGSMLWNASMGDISFSSGFGPRSMLASESIYVASDQQLLDVDLADGKWRSLIADPDYEFVPLAETDGILITRAKRTRGTTRFELWGVDTETGRRVWQHPFAGSEPLDEPDRMAGLIDEGDSAWTAHLTPAGLAVVQAMAQPHQLTVEMLNPRTGASGGTVAIPLSGINGDLYGVPEVLGWNRDQLWLILDGRMYVVNLNSSNLEFTWP